MTTKVCKVILKHGFKSLGKNGVSDHRLVCCFSREGSNNYIEVYKEQYGLSVHLFGKGRMNGYYPTTIDILEKDDVKFLDNFITRNII